MDVRIEKIVKYIHVNKFQYKWVIAFTSFLMIFMMTGLGNLPGSLYIVPVTGYYGFSRGDFSIVYTLITTVSMLGSFFYGFFLERFSVRSLVIFGAMQAPIGYFIFSAATTLPVFYIAAILYGISLSFGTGNSAFILIHNWFDRWQGVLLGFASAGSGFGGALFSLIVGNQIAHNGFKSSYLFTALTLAVIVIPVSLLIKSKPAETIVGEENNQDSRVPAQPYSFNSYMSCGAIFRNRETVLALVALFIVGLVIHSLLVSTPSILVEKGFETVYTARVISAIFFVLGIAKISLGYLTDKLGIKISFIIGLVSFVISAVVILFAASQWLTWIYIIFLGIAVATEAVLTPFLAKELLGKENYQKYVGVFGSIMIAGMALGVPLMNYTYDIFGSYSYIISIFSGLGIVALILVIGSLSNKDRRENGAPC